MPHASGTKGPLRHWENEPAGAAKPYAVRDYQTIGFVNPGRAELRLEGLTILLDPGNSWVVLPGSDHSRILQPFTAVEATTNGGLRPRSRPRLIHRSARRHRR